MNKSEGSDRRRGIAVKNHNNAKLSNWVKDPEEVKRIDSIGKKPANHDYDQAEVKKSVLGIGNKLHWKPNGGNGHIASHKSGAQFYILEGKGKAHLETDHPGIDQGSTHTEHANVNEAKAHAEKRLSAFLKEPAEKGELNKSQLTPKDLGPASKHTESGGSGIIHFKNGHKAHYKEYDEHYTVHTPERKKVRVHMDSPAGNHIINEGQKMDKGELWGASEVEKEVPEVMPELSKSNRAANAAQRRKRLEAKGKVFTKPCYDCGSVVDSDGECTECYKEQPVPEPAKKDEISKAEGLNWKIHDGDQHRATTKTHEYTITPNYLHSGKHHLAINDLSEESHGPDSEHGSLEQAKAHALNHFSKSSIQKAGLEKATCEHPDCSNYVSTLYNNDYCRKHVNYKKSADKKDGISKAERPMWLDKYPVAKEQDIKDLERAAAVNEFGGQAKDAAEEAAHKDYTIKQHTHAAAHHMESGKMARAVGNDEAARKHANYYRQHIEALGHSAYEAPPDSVKAISDEKPGGAHHFKNHPGDGFLLDGAKGG